MTENLIELWRDEEAVTTVEYALLLTTVVLAGIGAWTSLGQSVRDTVNDAASYIDTTTSTAN